MKALRFTLAAFVLAVLTALMFLATFYIQAHYAIDAIAGVVVGTAMYFFLKWFYGLLRRREKWS